MWIKAIHQICYSSWYCSILSDSTTTNLLLLHLWKLRNNQLMKQGIPNSRKSYQCDKTYLAWCQKIHHHGWQNRDPPTQKWVPVFPLCTNTSILAPAISLTTRLYSHLCSIYNQKYCHFIVVCNMFDQHPTIINNRCMDYTTSARETKTILLFFLIFIVPLCNWSTLQMLNYFMCNLHTM